MKGLVSMGSKIVGLDGKPTKQKTMQVPSLKLKEIGSLPFRRVDIKGIMEGRVQPKDAVIGTAHQSTDQTSVLLAGMYMLAKDIYSRSPKGSRHFEGFCEDLGLKFTNLTGDTIDPVKELGSIL